MPVEQVTLMLCLRELKTLGPWQKRRAASKNVAQGTKRHDAGSPVVTEELWDEQLPSPSWAWVICVVGGTMQSLI